MQQLFSAGLAYNDHKNYLENGLNLLKKIIKSSIDNEGFPIIKKHKTTNFLFKISYNY